MYNYNLLTRGFCESEKWRLKIHVHFYSAHEQQIDVSCFISFQDDVPHHCEEPSSSWLSLNIQPL